MSLRCRLGRHNTAWRARIGYLEGTRGEPGKGYKEIWEYCTSCGKELDNDYFLISGKDGNAIDAEVEEIVNSATVATREG